MHQRTNQLIVEVFFFFFCPSSLFIAPSGVIPTLCFKTFTEFRLGLSIWPQATFGVELVGHGGCSDHSLQAALALGHVLLWMEENHVDLRHVEHSQRDRRTEAYGDGQSCGLDVHLYYGRDDSGDRRESFVEVTSNVGQRCYSFLASFFPLRRSTQ